MTTPLLEIENLHTFFYTDNGVARAVDGVSFSVGVGETVGVVGESGCGKSVTALSILRLVRPPGRIEAGSVMRFEGRDLLELNEREMQHVRGNRIAMVFQEPMTALNPLMRIGDQLMEVFEAHDLLSPRERRAKALALVREVGLPDPDRIIRAYPHQLSGGQRQRAMIAMALACKPRLLLADEPTTALDATVQIQVLLLIRELQRELDLGVIFVTHDIGVAVEVSDRIGVMYAGKIVELAGVEQMVDAPQHPYSRGLLASTVHDGMRGQRLEAIPGAPPDLAEVPTGCSFAPRCRFVRPDCTTAPPDLRATAQSHLVRCVLATGAAA